MDRLRGTVWTSANLNIIIGAVVTIAGWALKRMFSRTDTFYDRMTKDARQKQEQIDWGRACMMIMDQEIWDYRQALADAGIRVPPRRPWPPAPGQLEQPQRQQIPPPPAAAP